MSTHEQVNPADDQTNDYVQNPDYIRSYMDNFSERLRPDINYDDPDLRTRLDTPLSELLAHTSVAEGLFGPALRAQLTVRDVLVLGVQEGMSGLPYIDDEHDAAALTAIERHVPEIPLLNGLAPVQVLRSLYDNPLDIPLSASSGCKVTVGSVIGTTAEVSYLKRIQTIMSDTPNLAATAPLEGPAPSVRPIESTGAKDAVAIAIEGVTQTLRGEK